MVESINDVIFTLNADGVIGYVSPLVQNVLGYDPAQLVGHAFAGLIHPDDLDAVNKAFADILMNRLHPTEFRIRTQSGGICWVRSSSRPVIENGKVTGIRGVLADITERKLAEEQIAASLKEKEVLLREIHHRVKNNMQVIISLLRMHSRRIDDARQGEVFDDCRDRVSAMSLIHETLYQSENLARIEFGDYLKKLCRSLSRMHGDSGKEVAVIVERNGVSLGMDQGVAVGMVICELVSNAFKHAFPQGKPGTVSISLTDLDEEEIEVIVQDDGIGLPPEIDIRNSPLLGLQLAVAAVTGELGGSIRVERDGGTRYIIRFRCKSA